MLRSARTAGPHRTLRVLGAARPRSTMRGASQSAWKLFPASCTASVVPSTSSRPFASRWSPSSSYVVRGTATAVAQHNYCTHSPTRFTMSQSNINEAKRAAGYKAVDENMKPTFRYVGIGSGSTVVYCVERLAQLRDTLPVERMFFVPTGYQSKQLIAEADLPMMEIDQFSANELDIVFDGADELDSNLNCIKGGGACLLQEKLVGKCSKLFVCVADESKVSHLLGEKWHQGIPVEVVPFAHKKIAVDIGRLGAVKITLRQGGKAKAGPIITDNGNFILDCDFGPIPLDQVVVLDQQLKLLVGVVETGLFDYVAKAYIGMADGSARVLTRPSDLALSTYGNGPLPNGIQ